MVDEMVPGEGVDELALAPPVRRGDGHELALARRRGDDPLILVAAALFAPDGDGLLDRARDVAATTRERQVVAIATAHRRGERELVDALARDHLVDHPDNVLVAWIADASHNHSSEKERS